MLCVKFSNFPGFCLTWIVAYDMKKSFLDNFWRINCLSDGIFTEAPIFRSSSKQPQGTSDSFRGERSHLSAASTTQPPDNRNYINTTLISLLNRQVADLFAGTTRPPDDTNDINTTLLSLTCHSSGAVWESRWTSWAVRPNDLSGFRGRKGLLNRASALVTTCP